MSAAREARRALLQSLAALLVLGALLLRLKRIERPRFEARATLLPGVIRGEVFLGARRLGESLRCEGREVVSHLGRGGFASVQICPDLQCVRVRDQGRAVTLRRQGCTIVEEGAERH